MQISPAVAAPRDPASFPPDLEDAFFAQATSALSCLRLAPPLGFAFRWGGIRFHGRVQEQQDAVHLRLAADLGPLPFTAENRPAREGLLALLLARPGAAVEGYEIDEAQHVIHYTEAALAGPVTRAGILAATVQLLLRSRPYLELAAACVGDQFSWGKSKICPG